MLPHCTAGRQAERLASLLSVPGPGVHVSADMNVADSNPIRIRRDVDERVVICRVPERNVLDGKAHALRGARGRSRCHHLADDNDFDICTGCVDLLQD